MTTLWSPESNLSAGTDLEREIGGLLQEAINHVENVLTPERAKATDYYFGRPFGNEEDGRSKVVDTTVRDTVQGMLPSLLRIFLGSERTVEFKADGPEDEQEAQQMTDYINYIIREDNDGFVQFHAAFLDAMVRKLGIFKFWWEKGEKVSGYQYEGLTEQNIQDLSMDPGVVIKNLEAYQLTTDSPVLYDADVTRTKDVSRARFEAIPPEEFLFTPRARSTDDALLLAHRREVRKSELVSMGYGEKLLDGMESVEYSISQNLEAQGRQIDESTTERDSDDFDPKYLYIESYVRSGLSWRKYCHLGPNFKIVNGKGKGEPVDSHIFAVMPCVLEPHTIVGQSIADLVMDLQKLRSAVVRGTVDSLGNAITPRTAVDQYNVEMQDMVNSEVGGIIRTKGPPSNSVMEFRHQFVGSDTLPFMQYLDQMQESRIGRNPGGIDPDTLQSSTKAAVAATLTSAQQRIEMLARVFAETGIKALFKGLLKLVVEHQDRARVVRLRNQYVEVDPRVWDATMDVTVHVGLGVGMPEEKMNGLMAIMAKQEQMIFGPMGPVNPLVSLTEYQHTLTRFAELLGYANPQEFFKQIDPQQLQAMTQAMSQPKQPSPEEMLAQVQMKSIEADTQNKQQRLMLDMQKMQLDDDRERDKAAADFAIAAAELELKYGTAVDVAKIKASAQQARQTQMGGPSE